MDTSFRKHYSIDVETLGLGDNALILSVAAVEFNPLTGEFGRCFYAAADYGENGEHAYGDIGLGTVLFWLRQPEVVRARAFGKDCTVEVMRLGMLLLELRRFLTSGEALAPVLWQRGDRDRVWIESACAREAVDWPFKFYEWRDQRTFCSEVLQDILPPRTDNMHHDALADAKYQARCIAAAYQRLAKISGITTLLAELYQVCGALGASAEVLDQILAAQEGGPLPHGTLLPYARRAR